MSSPRRKRERADRQELILRTARSIAETDGWDAVTTRRLAERIEYSQPVLYSHFAGKREIVSAVAVQGCAELTAVLRGATDLVAAYVEWGLTHPAVYDAMFSLATDLPWGTPDAPLPLLEAFAELRAAFGPYAGDADPDAYTEVCWSTLHGLVTLARSGRLRADLAAQRQAIATRMMALSKVT
jgi:AcrR family transcriptional regulator